MKTQNKVVPLFDNSTSIRIGDIVIHMDENGRYCLNDLHQASGGHGNDRPSIWLTTKTAKNYVTFLTDLSKNSCLASPIESIKGTANPGTYAVKELVYTYAAWISIKFHHEVISTYDKVIMAEHYQLESAQERLKHSILLNKDCPKSIIGTQKNQDINLLYQRMELDGLIIKQEIIKVLYRYIVTTKGTELFGVRNSLSGVRISEEYHNALRDLMQKILHEDQDDWTI
jgi:hypothetical protein